MNEKFHGKFKILNYTKSCLELIYSWPNADEIIVGDQDILINVAIIWFFMENWGIKPDQWSEELVDKMSEEGIKIKTNTMLDATVKNYTMKFLSNLWNVVWMNNLNVKTMRKYAAIFDKAAKDLESSSVAGFLKLSIIKYANQPCILSFNDTSRKVTTRHFACTVMIVHRGKASSVDIENFYALFNKNGGNEVKVIYLNDKITVI